VTAGSVLNAPGTYSLVATFTPTNSNAYASDAATRLLAVAVPDFSVASSAASLSIPAGQSATLTITVPAQYGFTGQVTIGSGPLPGGFTVTASPATVAAGGTSTVTIQTGGTGTSTASAREPLTRWGRWMGGGLGGGVALGCLLLMPLGRRRRLFAGLSLFVFLAMSAGMEGCGSGTVYDHPAVALTTSAAKVASGANLTLTATLSGGVSTTGGTVTFSNGGRALAQAVPVVGGVATLQTAALPVGWDSLTASYSGDRHDAGSTSSPVAQLVTGQTSLQITATSGSVVHATAVQVELQ
jgi:hypothetical protein